MEKAISTINQFDLTKSQINYFVEKCLMELDNENPLEFLPKLQAMETIVKELKSKLKHNLIMAASEYPEKTFELNGCKFTKTNRAVYDYSNTPYHVELKTKLKDLENTLKTIKTSIADAKTGEVYNPPIIKGSESISITLPK